MAIKNIIIIILVLVIVTLVGIIISLSSAINSGQGFKNTATIDNGQNTTGLINDQQRSTRQGKVLYVDQITKVINLSSSEQLLERFVLSNPVRLLDENGKRIEISDIMPGAFIRAVGMGIDQNLLIAEEVRIINTPNIVVDTPEPQALLDNPAVITGRARVFENTVNMQLKDAQGNVIGKAFAITDASAIGRFGKFEVELEFSAPETRTGTLEVFQISPKDGVQTDVVTISVRFASSE